MSKLVLSTVMILLVCMYAFKIRTGDNHQRNGGNQGGNGTHANSTDGWINGTDSNSTAAWENEWLQEWDNYYPYGGFNDTNNFNGTDGNSTHRNNTQRQ